MNRNISLLIAACFFVFNCASSHENQNSKESENGLSESEDVSNLIDNSKMSPNSDEHFGVQQNDHLIVKLGNYLINHNSENDVGGSKRDGIECDIPSFFKKVNDDSVMKFLVSRGYNIFNKNACQMVLHSAAEKGDDAAVRELVEYKDLLNIVDKEGRTPVWYAAKNQHWPTLALLMRSGGLLTLDVLKSSAWDNLFHGSNFFKVIFFRNVVESDYSTPDLFFLSLVERNYPLTKFLIDCGYDWNSNSNGNKYLWRPISRGDFKIADYMIKMGADIKYLDRRGFTLLHYAALLDESKDILDYLISRGLEVNIRDANRLTPLDVANGAAWNYLKLRGGKTSLQLENPQSIQ